MGARRLVSIFIMMLAFAVTATAQTPAAQGGGQPAPVPVLFSMTTTAFADGTDIPAKYTQAGNQTSPAIMWMNVPAGTVTFLLHMHDLEVSRNHTSDDQLHWIVWNIPASATGLPEGVPMGAQLQNGAYQLARPARYIADRARPPAGRGTITRLSFMPWIRKWTSSLGQMRLKPAQAL